MPGYHRDIGHHLEHWYRLAARGTPYLVCLTSERERAKKAPDYEEFLDGVSVRERWIEFPITDRSIPADMSGFLPFVDGLRELLCSAASVLVVHCAAGVGRTGMIAASVLVRAGLAHDDARARVRAAGSEPETVHQMRLVRSLGPAA
jgi:protein-tyrosine phosphatase